MTYNTPSSHIEWNRLFSPESIAVIGASNTRGTWGYTTMQGLLGTGTRRLYPVNPKGGEILGLKAYQSILDVPETVDLAVIVVAAPLVAQVMQQCADKGLKMAVVISAGFAEMGDEGKKLEDEVVSIARQAGIRFTGPNSMGHASTGSQVSTFGQKWNLSPGPVAVLSQSGNMCLGIVRKGLSYGLSFSKYVSTGNEASLHMEDYLEYLAQDKETRVIAAYLEGLREGRRFLNLARRLTTQKPVVILKAGGTETSARAVKSHTGALAGADTVYTAAFRQAGVIRVEDEEELCDVVFALLNSPLPKGNRIGILSIGGGPGALAAEACEKEGMVIGQLEPATIDKLDASLPPRWSRRNPVDMGGISAEDYPLIASCLRTLMDDCNIDAVFLQGPLVATREQLVDRAGLDPEELKAYREKERVNLRLIRQKIEESGKPVVVLGQSRGNMTDPAIASAFDGERILVYSGVRRAARVMRHLAGYRQYLDRAKNKI